MNASYKMVIKGSSVRIISQEERETYFRRIPYVFLSTLVTEQIGLGCGLWTECTLLVIVKWFKLLIFVFMALSF